MEEKYKPIKWTNDDVIAFSEEKSIKASALLKVIQSAISKTNFGSALTSAIGDVFNLRNDSVTFPNGTSNNPYSKWFEEGLECEVMSADDAKSWRKRKIKIKLNFTFELWEETEEPDSPLDNFRESEEKN